MTPSGTAGYPARTALESIVCAGPPDVGYHMRARKPRLPAGATSRVRTPTCALRTLPTSGPGGLAFSPMHAPAARITTIDHRDIRRPERLAIPIAHLRCAIIGGGASIACAPSHTNVAQAGLLRAAGGILRFPSLGGVGLLDELAQVAQGPAAPVAPLSTSVVDPLRCRTRPRHVRLLFC